MKRNHVRYSHCLDDPIKMAMFRSAIANNMVAFDLIVKAFCLSYDDSDHFVMLVRQFVQQKKYKEVIYLFFSLCVFFFNVCMCETVCVTVNVCMCETVCITVNVCMCETVCVCHCQCLHV